MAPLSSSMKLMHRAAKLVVVLCMVLYQVQLYAAAVMGCQHSAEGDSGVLASGCPYHKTAGDDNAPLEPTRALDCHKCALHLAMGGVIEVNSPIVLSFLPQRSSNESRPEQHFYCFIPDSFFRPPIEVTSQRR